MLSCPNHASPRQRGFSIVELMVGVTLGLIASIAIMHVFTTGEAQRRTTSGSSDTQTTGTVALFNLQREIRLSGWGFTSLDALNCTVHAYNSARSTASFTIPNLAPIIINPPTIPAGDANSDILFIAHGNGNNPMIDGMRIATQSETPFNDTLSNSTGLGAGIAAADMILGVRSASSTTCNGGPCTCTLSRVSADYSNSATIVPYSAGENNPSTGPNLGYAATSSSGPCSNGGPSGPCLFNLGPNPTFAVYAVRGGELTRCDLLTEDCTSSANTGNPNVWVPIGANVVALRAEYGQDTNVPMDGVIDAWNQTNPNVAAAGANCAWTHIRAVRIGLLLRNAISARDSVTSTAPTWLGSATTPFSLSAISDSEQYRYQVFQAVVPLRNVLWMDLSSCTS